MTRMTIEEARQHANHAGQGGLTSLNVLLSALANGEVFETNAGDPSGSVLPKAQGSWLLDTTNNIWYRSKGTANTDWVVVGVASLPEVQRSLTALSNAQLLALAATPVEVVAAPGAGKFIQVLDWRFRLIFVATAMDDAAADGDLTLEYDGGSTIDTMQADGLIDAAATTQGLSGNLTELLVAETGIANKAVDISNDGAEFTASGGGDATAEVEVFYRILDTNPS